MMKKNVLLSMGVLLVATSFALNAMADSPIHPVQGSTTFDVIVNSINIVIGTVVNHVQAQAILWLSSFVMIQFLITNLGLLKSGADIEAIFGKLMGSLLWFGFCFYVIANGADFINKVGSGFLTTAGTIFKTGPLNAGNLMNQGVAVGANLISTIYKVAGITDVGSLILGGLCGLFVIVVMAYIACKVFIMKIELALVVMLSPLSFSFLGLNALKDQGIAPFKSLIGLIYRIMVLVVIIAGIDLLTEQVNLSIVSIYNNASFWTKLTGVGNGVWPVLLGITGAYLILGFLAYKSDSIAASLSSGSTNLGSADVAGAAAMGAAMGAAAMTGGTSLAAGAAKAGMPMGDFLKGLTGGGGSISNASSGGTGSAPVGPAPVRAATPSGSSTPLPSAKAPVRPTAPTSSNGSAPTASKGFGASGSGENASIGGSPNNLEQKVENLVDAMSNKDKKRFKDHVSDMNDHIAREQATTHVSINTHNTD